MAAKAKYYEVILFLDKEYHTIWKTNQQDRFLVTGDKKLLCFTERESLLAYIHTHHISLQEEPPSICDVNRLARWKEDYAAVLDFWNLVGDLAASVGDNFIGNRKSDGITPLYKKLFYACNLPSILPKKKYIPAWSAWQEDMMNKIIQRGIRLIVKHKRNGASGIV